MPIPFEIITMLGSSLVGGLMTIWAESLRAKREQHSMLMDKINANNKSVRNARNYGKTDKAFSFTRRTIALAAVASIIVWPKIVAVFFPQVPVFVGTTELVDGFLFFSSDKDVVKWDEMVGLVITPLDTHLVSAIVGLYFGHSTVKR